jgi:hypothetical protein
VCVCVCFAPPFFREGGPASTHGHTHSHLLHRKETRAILSEFEKSFGVALDVADGDYDLVCVCVCVCVYVYVCMCVCVCVCVCAMVCVCMCVFV